MWVLKWWIEKVMQLGAPGKSSSAHFPFVQILHDHIDPTDRRRYLARHLLSGTDRLSNVVKHYSAQFHAIAAPLARDGGCVPGE